MKKLFIFLFIMISFSVMSFGQTGASATATSTATIVKSIEITKTTDMNFGNVSVNSLAGTVVLVPAGTRSSTGGVKLPATTGTVSPAIFTVSGESGYAYTVTLPTSLSLVGTPSGTMIANTFTSDATATIAGGSVTLKVGATLNVGASQAAGVYTNSVEVFTVTVNYN